MLRRCAPTPMIPSLMPPTSRTTKGFHSPAAPSGAATLASRTGAPDAFASATSRSVPAAHVVVPRCEAGETEEVPRLGDGLGLGDVLVEVIFAGLGIDEEERPRGDDRARGRSGPLSGDEGGDVIEPPELVLRAAARLERSGHVRHDVEPRRRRPRVGDLRGLGGARGLAARLGRPAAFARHEEQRERRREKEGAEAEERGASHEEPFLYRSPAVRARGHDSVQRFPSLDTLRAMRGDPPRRPPSPSATPREGEDPAHEEREVPRTLTGGPVKFGPYWLDARLAVGGTAEVYLARPTDPAAGPQRLIVKRLLPHFVLDPEGRTMFEREAALHAAVHHENVVTVFGSGTATDDEPYLAMEYVEGVDGYRLLRRLAQSGKRLPIAVSRARRPRGAPRPRERAHGARTRTARRWGSSTAT